MKPGTVPWVLSVPLVAYAGVLLLDRPLPLGPLALAGTLAFAWPITAALDARWRFWAFAPAVAALGALGLTAVDASTRGLAEAIAVALLLGGPLGWLGVAWCGRESPAGPITTVLGSVTLATVLVAIGRALPGGTLTVGEIVGRVGVLFHDQASAWAVFARGGAVPAAPFAGGADALLAALDLLPLAGLLATWLWRPRSPDPSADATVDTRPPTTGHAVSLLTTVGALAGVVGASAFVPAEDVLLASALLAAGIFGALALRAGGRRTARVPVAKRATRDGRPPVRG